MAFSLCTMYEFAVSGSYCSCVKKEALLVFKVIDDGVKRKCTAQFQPECFSAVVFHLWTQRFHGEHFKWRSLVFNSVASCLVICTIRRFTSCAFKLSFRTPCICLSHFSPSFHWFFSLSFLMRRCTWAVGILRSSCVLCHVLLTF